MKRMDCLADMACLLPAEACKTTRAALEPWLDYFDGIPIERVSFAELLGGPAYLVERVEDLAAVRSFDEGREGRLSLLDAPSGSFDIAEWVEGGNFARFIAIDTAEGGAQFFVPREVAKVAPNVTVSIELWQAAMRRPGPS